MSRRRRRVSTGMTLFAFQDIIMSTSGIVIMIVLLLTLELVNNEGKSSNPTQPIEVGHLEKNIQTLETAIELLKERASRSDMLMQTASILSPLELQLEIETSKAINAKLQQEVDLQKSDLRRMAQMSEQVSEEQKLLVELDSQLRSLEQEKSQLLKETANVIEEDRPVFTLPVGSRRMGWIVDVSSQQVVVAPLGRAQAPTVFQPKSSIISDVTYPSFLKWAKRQPQLNLYFLLLVRPDGAAAFQSISKELDDLDIDYGFDLTSAEQKLLDPKQGAVK